MKVGQKALTAHAQHRITPQPFLLLLVAMIFVPRLLALAEDGANAHQQLSQAPVAASTSAGDQPFQRLREGTQLLNELGTFKPAGERIIFLAASGKGRYVCLENLNLERIGRLVRDNPENLQWEISGAVTEYGGANYLAVSRAILRSKTRSRKDGN